MVVLTDSIAFLDISVRTAKALQKAGYTKIMDVVLSEASTIKAIKGIGDKGFEELVMQMHKNGFDFIPFPEKKSIFVINGSGGVGKDTFVQLVFEAVYNKYVDEETGGKLPELKNGPFANYSYIEHVKDIAQSFGWNGGKTEKDRKFLADLLVLDEQYRDSSYRFLYDKVKRFFIEDMSKRVLFIHVRNPKNIKRLVREYNAKTILVTSEKVSAITSNAEDKSVFGYKYDIHIKNDGTFDELKEKAVDFVNKYI